MGELADVEAAVLVAHRGRVDALKENNAAISLTLLYLQYRTYRTTHKLIGHI